VTKLNNIIWKSTHGWNIYYYTDGIKHGETTNLEKASKVNYSRFEILKSRYLIPENAQIMECKTC
jgi:hypothetical protein